MKFILAAVNAKYIHSNPAVYSLRAYVRTYKQHVEIAEYTINQRMESILADIYKRRPDVVGFSCYIWNITLIRELIVELHKVLPQVPIWLGGPEVSFDAAEMLAEYTQLTGIIIGEGEEIFLELLQYYAEGEGQKTLKDIAGIVTREGVNPVRELTQLDNLPFLYEETEAFANRIIYYESSRGCPFSCSYCLSSIDKRTRFRNEEMVKEELLFFLRHKVKQVKFVDRTFNCNAGHALGIWRFLRENDNGVTNFHFEIAADLLQEEELRVLHSMRPGLVQLEIGVQSVNPATLEAIRRKTDMEKLQAAVRHIREGGNIHQHLDLIVGLPYEDYETFAHSFNVIYGMKPDQLQVGFLKVLKGSPMMDRKEEYGILYTENPPYEVLATRWLSYDEVLRLKEIEEMVELYYNSSQFMHTIAVLEEAFSSPFALYEELAHFYEEKGYLTSQPSRVYRYEILLEFARKWDAEREELYKELLTYDLYLRENLKSRPSFAPVQEEHRERLREFSRSNPMGKQRHMEIFSYPVWKMRSIFREEERGEYVVLFDYERRSPLTHEAVIEIENGLVNNVRAADGSQHG